MSRLQFKDSPDPFQNIRWALQDAVFVGAFVLVAFALNQADLMLTTFPVVKAVLLLGLLINFLYFCGYIIIASIKYAARLHATRKR